MTTRNVTQLKELLSQMELVDLTFTMEVGMPTWPTHPRFYHDVVETYSMGDIACHYQIVMGEHCGTHMDAPLHFVPEGSFHYGIDQVPLNSVCGRAATIEADELGENELLTVEKVKKWEKENGEIIMDDIVLLHFGWDKYWAKKPDYNRFLSNWPGLSEAAAEYLANKQVKVVGTDALALDAFNKGDESPCHKILLGKGILIIENLNNLTTLKPFSFFQAFPLKIKAGSGSPIRAIAFQ